MNSDGLGWTELLGAYEAHLDQQDAFLSWATANDVDDELLDVAPPSAFVIPHGMPAAPPHLRERMEYLQARTAEIERRAGDALSLLDRPRRGRRTTEATEASMLDRSI